MASYHLGKTQRRILKELREWPCELTTYEIAGVAEISRRAALSGLNRLYERGLVERINGTKPYSAQKRWKWKMKPFEPTYSYHRVWDLWKTGQYTTFEIGVQLGFLESVVLDMVQKMKKYHADKEAVD